MIVVSYLRLVVGAPRLGARASMLVTGAPRIVAVVAMCSEVCYKFSQAL
jgi:hypothetical protein